MKQTSHLNNTVPIDLPLLIDSRLLVQANSGGGKSWFLRRILEQSHGKVQQIVIDLEGEFSPLREKYDYVLVGKGGDTPADPRSAALLARKLLEHRVSAIIDLYELHHQERKRFVRLFLESRLNAPKELWHPGMVVMDEAHIFVPEKGESEAAEAVIDLATRGRKRGFCAVLATQRLSKLHKDAACLVVMLPLGPSGRENSGHLLVELVFPVRDLGGMPPVCPGELVDCCEPFDRVQGDSSCALSTLTFPLCRHLLSPPPSPIATAFYLHHLSSFRGTLYKTMDTSELLTQSYFSLEVLPMFSTGHFC